MKRALVAAAVLALSACATASEEAATVPAPPATAAPVQPITPRPQADACGARELQHLVGRPRSEIPVPVDPSRQRVACTTCPVTMDYSPERLNFFFDAETGVIKQVRCG